MAVCGARLLLDPAVRTSARLDFSPSESPFNISSPPRWPCPGRGRTEDPPPTPGLWQRGARSGEMSGAAGGHAGGALLSTACSPGAWCQPQKPPAAVVNAAAAGVERGAAASTWQPAGSGSSAPCALQSAPAEEEAACWRTALHRLHMRAARPGARRCVGARALSAARARAAEGGRRAHCARAEAQGCVPVLCVSLAACEVKWMAMKG